MSRTVTTVEYLDISSQLGKELIPEYEAEDATVATIVAALLNFQVLTPAITLGTISDSYSGLTRSIKVSGDTILRALFRLRDTIGGYIEVDNDRKLNWASSIGEDKGQQIRYRKNLQGIERDIDYNSLVNRLYAYGEGEGEARIKLSDVASLLTGNANSGQKDVAVVDGSLFAADDTVTISDDDATEDNTIASIAANTLTMTTNLANTYTTVANGQVNRKEDYIEDTTSQGAPPAGWGGIYVGVMINRSITHPDTLLAWANLKLAEVKNPLITYSIDTVDLSESTEVSFGFDSLQLGSTVKVIDEELGIDVSVKVVKIEHPDLLHPEQMNLELATRTKDITDSLLEVYDRQQFDSHIATTLGAGQVVVKGPFTVIDWVTDGTTNIKGDYIRTGVIQSNNWAVGAGSQFNLDDGTFKLGGSAAPKLSWDGATLIVSGTIYATAGEFTGTIKVSNIEAGKTLTVNGIISAGGGNVTIDSSSISMRGEMLRFYTGGEYVGVIYANATDLRLLSMGDIDMYCGSDIIVNPNGRDIRPYAADDVNLGKSSYYFRLVRCVDVIYYCPMKLPQEALRKIKNIRTKNEAGIEVIDKDTLSADMLLIPNEEDYANAEDIYKRALSRYASSPKIAVTRPKPQKFEPKIGISSLSFLGLVIASMQELADKIDVLEARVANN